LINLKPDQKYYLINWCNSQCRRGDKYKGNFKDRVNLNHGLWKLKSHLRWFWACKSF